MKKPVLVVIGNGMVGQRFLQCLHERKLTGRYAVFTFCEEPRPAYDRVHLSDYFSGKSAAQLSLVDDGFFGQAGITSYIGDKVIQLDRRNRRVLSAQGREISYDRVVLATGSYPFVPPIRGNDGENCFVYRTIEDLDAIRAAAVSARVGVVVGGGLLGLEAANALKTLGLQTHVVEFAPRLMAIQIDDWGAAMLRQKIEALGVTVHTSRSTTEISAGESHRQRMCFVDGDSLETDLIVFSAGIRPQDQLARDSGLEVGQRGGIVVNDQCLTSDPAVFAIGECALWNNQIFGLVAPGYQMADTVARQLQGEAGEFLGADMSTKLKLMGVDVASIGDAHARESGARSYTFIDEHNGIYKKLVVSVDGRKMLGGVLIGDAEDYGTLLQYKLNGIELPEFPDSLILPQRGNAANTALGIASLPDAAQICSCNNVSKGALLRAITGGARELPNLKSCTKAGTSCGGCAVLVGQILNCELEKLGIAVNRSLCEHFAYTRQDLYMLVRSEKIRTFQKLIERHGTGLGCDICKPTVASILASCWNDFVLSNENASLQDTNDHFLANMQKDGTYSIVPRIPGGEITPQKLIVLGDVAKRYGLYSKITGAQRVDLFGARVHQLPAIWKELIDAGFESGHAYAKALRTVKSCVGNSWCRYGVQDSVSMAIQLENRYKGLRSPHKIKMAVSGCTRECAEAQSKDVGVIATEKGWNLYVCGNGGMKPRHADLFASDLDDATLVKYIDRFLMFYVRTADRLQRTSTWMTNLEGGLEYLREVVINDRLGLGVEFEAEMALLVDTYACEWKKTLDDPGKMQRFRHFINSDKSDSNVVFVQERDQIRPAREAEKVQALEIV
jgi:nitrite reductase (NADH) large subunit